MFCSKSFLIRFSNTPTQTPTLGGQMEVNFRVFFVMILTVNTQNNLVVRIRVRG